MLMPRSATPALLALFLLAGCVSALPDLRADGTAVIPGSETDGMSRSDAMQAVLTDGARIAVDHGYQYFRIVSTQGLYGTSLAVRPGADVTIKVYREGQIYTRAPGVWNAQQILTNGPPASIGPSTTPRAYAPGSAGKLTPRCNAFGCEW